MTTAKALYQRWINELWTGKTVAAEVVSDDFVGHWPNRDVHGPDELQAMVDETQKMLSDSRRSGAIHRQRHPAVRRRLFRRVLDGHLHRLASTFLDNFTVST